MNKDVSEPVTRVTNTLAEAQEEAPATDSHSTEQQESAPFEIDRDISLSRRAIFASYTASHRINQHKMSEITLCHMSRRLYLI